MVWSALIPAAVQLGSSFLGSKANSKAASRIAEQQMLASMPRNITGPTGSSTYNPEERLLELGLSPGLQDRLGQLGGLATPLFGLLSDPNFVSSEVERLRGIARPQEDQLRASLRSQIYNRGRLGLGVGGGITGNAYNPELAALEEAFARADTGRVGAARGEQQRLLGNLFGLLGQEQDIRSAPNALAALSLQTPANYGAFGAQNLGLQSQMGFNSGAFGEFGKGLGGLFGGLFGGGAGGYVPPVNNPGDYSLPYF